MVYSRRCEPRRSRTRRCEERRRRGRLRGWCARFPPVSFPFSLSLSLVEPLRSSLGIIYNLLLSLSLSPFLSPSRGSRLKTRSKSRRRVASSRFGDSKEGSFLFPTLYRRLYLRRGARVLRLYFASSHDDVAGAKRNQTRNARSGSRERSRSLFGRAFWVAYPRRPFSEPDLSRFFLPFFLNR